MIRVVSVLAMWALLGCSHTVPQDTKGKQDSSGRDCLTRLPGVQFRRSGATHILIVDMLSAASSDTRPADSLAPQLEAELRRFMTEALAGEGRRAPPRELELQRLRCEVEEHEQLVRLAQASGAHAVLWGRSSCPSIASAATADGGRPQPYRACLSATLRRGGQVSAEQPLPPGPRGNLAQVDLPSLDTSDASRLVTLIIGLHFIDLGERRLAERFFDRSLKDIVFRPHDHNLAALLTDVARAHLELSPAAGQATIAFSHQSLKSVEGTAGVVEGALLGNIGAALNAQGNAGGAIEYLQRALAIHIKAVGRDHPFVAIDLDDLGMAAMAQGEHSEAGGHFSRAGDIYERALGKDHPRAVVHRRHLRRALGGTSEALAAALDRDAINRGRRPEREPCPVFPVVASSAQLWRVHNGERIGAPLLHEDNVVAASFSPDGKRVLTASRDGTARLWDGLSGEPVGGPLRHEQPVESASFSSDGKRVVTVSANRTVRLWDTANGNPRGQPVRDVVAASLSPDGRRLVTASSGAHTARFWDAVTGRPLGQPLEHGDRMVAASFSPDGKRVVTLSGESVARLWDVTSGRAPRAHMLPHDRPPNLVTFSRDGKRLLTACEDKYAQVWDVSTGKELGARMRHVGLLTAASFSADGKRVVTASFDSTASLWDAVTGEPVGQPMHHADWVHAASFSPDGTRVVTASHDGTARLWDARTGERVGQPLRHDGPVVAASFSPRGERIVTATATASGRLEGYVELPSSAYKDAVVSAHPVRGGPARITRPDEGGAFAISALALGPVTVDASAPKSKPLFQPQVCIRPSTTTEAYVYMETEGMVMCRMMSCGDRLNIRIRRDHGRMSGLAASLEIGGRRIDCAPAKGRQPCSREGVSVELREIEDCGEGKGFRDEEGRWRCTPTGRFEQLIIVEGSPASVPVVLSHDGQLVARRTLRPRYSGVYVNGPGCAPACQSADEIWVVP